MNKSSERTLHFTLGPVQGFVAQARRTRDLWAGSFLLSYLSGAAMLAVLEAGGTILFPDVGDRKELKDPLLRAMYMQRQRPPFSQGSPGGTGPDTGSLPNRFMARIPDEFQPDACVQAIKNHWQMIAQTVWERFLEPCREELPEIHGQTRRIWERQVHGFWEMNWVIGEDSDMLDRRKNWRSYVPTVEPGSKCTIMGNYQELSGYERVSAQERQLQEKFWSMVQNKMPDLDRRPDERLCAIALIKRLFPVIDRETIGWQLPRHFPSTAAVAALPWVAERIESDPQGCREFVALFPQANHSERDIPRSALVVEALAKQDEDQALVKFASLNAELFFIDHLRNERLWNLITKVQRSEAVQRLLRWRDRPSPFYALLLMDGDRLGEMLQKKEGDRTYISRALARFMEQVEEIIQDWSGFLIYAGGDDVLAMLPLETALDAAVELRTAYREAFVQECGNGTGVTAGISAAIVFAHHSLPLRDVLREAHRLLDEKAKEETGRDSLAVTALLSSGRVFVWAAPWDFFLQSVPSGERHTERNKLKVLVEKFKRRDKADGPLNTSFLYNLRSRYELLASGETKGDEEFYRRLFTAEYMKNRERKISKEMAHELMAELYAVCQKNWRLTDGTLKKDSSWRIDGALLVNFLVEKGRVGNG